VGKEHQYYHIFFLNLSIFLVVSARPDRPQSAHKRAISAVADKVYISFYLISVAEAEAAVGHQVKLQRLGASPML
jgi:hypothetical protein